jgi:hypothetical protein
LLQRSDKSETSPLFSPIERQARVIHETARRQFGRLRLAAGKGLVDAFRFGVAAGSAAVLNPTTELYRAPDVMQLYERIDLAYV